MEKLAETKTQCFVPGFNKHIYFRCDIGSFNMEVGGGRASSGHFWHSFLSSVGFCSASVDILKRVLWISIVKRLRPWNPNNEAEDAKPRWFTSTSEKRTEWVTEKQNRCGSVAAAQPQSTPKEKQLHSFGSKATLSHLTRAGEFFDARRLASERVCFISVAALN